MNILESLNVLMTMASHPLFWVSISFFVGVCFLIYTLRRQITISYSERKRIVDIGSGLIFTLELITIFVAIATGRPLPSLLPFTIGLLAWITINSKPAPKQ
jgi:uncharacterized membrane protein